MLWQKYRAYPTNVYEARTRLVQYMNNTRAPTYVGIGRWCRHAAPPGISEVTSEGRNMGMELWTKGWYCINHRPWIRCTSCGWKYSCVICTNPHSCPHCKTGFRCTWDGCWKKSDDRPAGTRARATYVKVQIYHGGNTKTIPIVTKWLRLQTQRAGNKTVGELRQSSERVSKIWITATLPEVFPKDRRRYTRRRPNLC